MRQTTALTNAECQMHNVQWNLVDEETGEIGHVERQKTDHRRRMGDEPYY